MLHFERYGKRNDQSAHTRIPANEGLFNHSHRSLFKAIVMNFHEFTNFPKNLFENTDYFLSQNYNRSSEN